MKKVLVIYDDTIKSKDRVKTIIGNNSFGQIVLKRKKLYQYVADVINELNEEIVKINENNDYEKVIQGKNDCNYCYLKSSSAISDTKEFKFIIDKIKYIKETTKVVDENDNIMAIAFAKKEEYIDFVELLKTNNLSSFKASNTINCKCFTNIENYKNLLMYISSGFDARYFNTLEGDHYTITKSSADKKKMKMEYTYYWLLPDSMKTWMVMPYDFKETDEKASYKMERMPMSDIAIRFTHRAIDLEEFNNILDKVFYFFSSRTKKEISKKEYVENLNKLYIDKVKTRIAKLKECEEFKKIECFIQNSTEYKSIDDIVEVYVRLYQTIIDRYLKTKKNYYLVIGHGDVFFANMLYSKEINLLRLIDPKGGFTLEDLWSDPYYDVAKLSHSICGLYDFFNTDMYDISMDKDLNLKLYIDFDNQKYVEMFKKYLIKYDYNYKLVRLFESSLFLSMLPLHIDNPRKVMGFILNAINILKEVEKNV